ncbi:MULTISPECIES: tagaturonate reductase [unclassified Oceanispirochaeta]|uniref:tagaturonate reductase n=1 Tax=unclassified Oceanispirochaeta TaxID=2635722 RepID=UPI000E096C4F|nr:MULTISPECIES: tagaturonate reductase [unclassified Oceanispirochaeta]MBF9014299.1 tagaturonate reductase [Oceanispirochaeta sp. M2]NPD71185.1 tagaturonate reductase [Oceanispirochaeta sp. M1]RDG33575.1 tagaturonate reductase [Oceanispirochaeta sp. M1]
MKQLNLNQAQEMKLEKNNKPVRILQFGEGNFLRAFIDWMVDGMNKQNLFNGKISIVQPLPQGMIGMMGEQDYLYTLLLRGIQGGEVTVEKKIIDAVERGVNPYEDFEAYLAEAENPDLRIIVSNTTEAGIVLREEDSPGDTPPVSFPGKLLLLLKKRYDHFEGDPSKGFLLFPCELIEENGTNLKNILLDLAGRWYSDSPAFLSWIDEANVFFNTLVDRIVSGYPRDEVEGLWEEAGYKDNLLDTGEIFHFLVIEGPSEYEKEFPLVQGGFNVKWCDDLTPYRTRKVRILNGAHTMTVLAAWLYGLETVKNCMDDELVSAYIRKGIFDEIIPTLDLPADELSEYGAAILERFSNPYIKHFLLSISLNSVSKFKTRVLPSILEYINRTGENPRLLSFSLAALVLFYKSTGSDSDSLTALRALDGKEYTIRDSPEVLEYFSSLWNDRSCDSRKDGESIMDLVLKKEDYWGQDLSLVDGLSELTGSFLYSMVRKGVPSVMAELTGVSK